MTATLIIRSDEAHQIASRLVRARKNGTMTALVLELLKNEEKRVNELAPLVERLAELRNGLMNEGAAK